jgi:hypothetical protein
LGLVSGMKCVIYVLVGFTSFEIPPCQQTLVGFPRDETPADNVKFGVLNYPSTVEICVLSNATAKDVTTNSRDR